MKNFKIGIIGFGNIGKKRLEAIKKIKKIKIEVVYISDINAYIKIPKGIKFISNWKKVKNISVDLIIISTPTYLTEIIAKEFAGNFNLLIEKPITTNLRLLNKITNEANKNKKILKTGYNLRFDEGLTIIKKIIDTNKIGKIYYCKIAKTLYFSKIPGDNNKKNFIKISAANIALKFKNPRKILR